MQMKKLTLIIGLLALAGCRPQQQQAEVQPARFTIHLEVGGCGDIWHQPDLYLITDTKTGAEFILVDAVGHLALQPVTRAVKYE